MFSSGSVLNVNRKQITLLEAETSLTPLDYVALSISTTCFVGYHVFYWYMTTYKLHSTLSSHVHLSRITWTKYIYYDYKNKVITIQTFRSCLVIVAYYITVVGSAASVLFVAARQYWWTSTRPIGDGIPPGALRGIVPAVLLLVSLSQLVLTLMSYLHLHFHTQVEDLDDAERIKFGFKAPEDVAPEATRVATAALAIQCNMHFRFGWRLMVVALVYMLWTFSPIALIVGSVVVTAHMYSNDFPFSASNRMWDQLLASKDDMLKNHMKAKREEIAQAFYSLPS